MEPTTFGEVLRRERAAAGLSQKALSAKAGISQASLSDLERGQSLPAPDTFRALREALPALQVPGVADLALGHPLQAA